MKRYSPELARETYDVIVIGSGIGGMTTASFCARAGKKVLVLERHDVPGGFSHTFKRKGYEWDVGVHYVGQMGKKTNLMRRIFDYVSDGKLEWASLGDVYDRVVMNGKTYDFYSGREKQLEQLVAYFPEEEAAIRKYYAITDSFFMSTGLFFGERSMPKWLSFLVGPLMRFSFKRKARKTTYEVLREMTSNEELIAVLCAQCGDYGLPPRKSSWGIHAGLINHYVEGGYYPVGGAASIHRSILNGVEARGGTVALKAEVASIEFDGRRAVGVRMADGTVLRAKKVVSNAGARNSFLKLWPRGVKLPSAIAEELPKIKPSVAHVCLYVGLSASDEALRLPKHNIWMYGTRDFDLEFAKLEGAATTEPMLAYISFPSAKDPAWAAKHPNRATVQVIAPCPYAWVEHWRETKWMKRGEDYEAFKQRWQDALLAKLIEVVPQIKDHIDYCEVSTPLSTEHFSNYPSGEIYGLEHTPSRMMVRWLRAHTPLKGYFLTGQDVVMVGVGGALFSGVITAVAVLKRNVLWPVFRN